MPSKAGDKNTYMRKLLKFTSITSREYRILRISYCKIELGKSKKTDSLSFYTIPHPMFAIYCKNTK